MTAKEQLRNSLSVLDTEQQRMVLAVGIVLDRMKRLSQEDSDDLFALLKEYMHAESAEDRAAADSAIMEILEQKPISVGAMSLSEDDRKPSPKLQCWLDWVSKRIHDLRENVGMTQERLAELSGLPQSHISRLENGKHSPSRFTLEKIASALGVDVGEFDPSLE